MTDKDTAAQRCIPCLLANAVGVFLIIVYLIHRVNEFQDDHL